LILDFSHKKYDQVLAYSCFLIYTAVFAVGFANHQRGSIGMGCPARDRKTTEEICCKRRGGQKAEAMVVESRNCL
jgi:hypothetical protein